MSLSEKRAIRRHLLVVKKQKYRRVVKKVWSNKELADDPKFIGRMVQTPHPCSRMCCGNPRRHQKGKKCRLTLQEQKVDKANVA
jgi:hypothetical protein